ncbi:hypothetical protein ZHAS_00017408 [Anopheles sinensis]|uniref:Uncharacterized protein n=1 Tax=Anopheles sinensis TaxID=74873 RepID=A0A084WGE9_ANOSI|nr:hypothetical protein ZHAS_00017408 [Anopheles sinensis]
MTAAEDKAPGGKRSACPPAAEKLNPPTPPAHSNTRSMRDDKTSASGSVAWSEMQPGGNCILDGNDFTPIIVACTVALMHESVPGPGTISDPINARKGNDDSGTDLCFAKMATLASGPGRLGAR